MAQTERMQLPNFGSAGPIIRSTPIKPPASSASFASCVFSTLRQADPSNLFRRSVMTLLISAWPALTLLLPALVVLSALIFLVKGNRRAFAHLVALLACFFIGALLMEFFTFMGALMARSGSQHAEPVLGAGTRKLLETIANPRSITAPPLSLAAWAAYSILAAYVWLLVVWVMHWRGKKSGTSKKKSTSAPRKAAKA